MDFEIIGELTEIVTIATGTGVRDRARLRRTYGPGRWRKRKGIGSVRLPVWQKATGRSSLVRSSRNWKKGIQIEVAIPG